jgi:basic membrane protein A
LSASPGGAGGFVPEAIVASLGERTGRRKAVEGSMRKRLLLLLAVLTSLSLVAAACGDDDDDTSSGGGGDSEAECPDGPVEGDPNGTSVGLLFDLTGRGDQSFNDAAACGLDRAAEDFDINPSESVPTADADRPERLRLLAGNNELVIGVGFLWGSHITEGAADFPDVQFVQIDGSATGSNVTLATFAEHEGSFLVGAAAALTSETKKIGFLGGVNNSLIQKFEAGFIAGAEAADEEVEVEVEYITPDGDFTGFTSPDRAREIATRMFQDDVDIIYAAAGQSGGGMFAAAQEYSESSGSKVWGIGVDSDQYFTVGSDLQEYVLTSMLKRVDVAVYDSIEKYINDELEAGEVVYDLAVDGVGYSTSGDFLEGDVIDQVNEFRQQIIDGDITVPDSP